MRLSFETLQVIAEETADLRVARAALEAIDTQIWSFGGRIVSEMTYAFASGVARDIQGFRRLFPSPQWRMLAWEEDV